MFKRLPVVKKQATTTSGVLKQTLGLLEKEGRWIQGRWFKNNGQTLDPEAPLCDQGWGACLDGMLLAVTCGVPVEVYGGGSLPAVCSVQDNSGPAGTDEQRERYYAAAAFLDTYINDHTPNNDGIVSFNDTRAPGKVGRTQVIDMVRKAYRHAQYTERVQRAAARQGVAV